jgi:hypothetical protein
MTTHVIALSAIGRFHRPIRIGLLHLISEYRAVEIDQSADDPMAQPNVFGR